MVLKLYGSLSAAVIRVYCILLEKNVPFELVPIDLSKGENRTPEYLAKQPFGQIPYIDDDGFILFESRAICHYIATKYANQGPELIPQDLQKNALYQQWASVEAFHFETHAVGATTEEFYKPVFRGQKKDQAAYDDHLVKLGKTLDVYEKVLSKQKYLIGDELTIVDLNHLPYAMILGARAGTQIMEDESRPNVVRWYKDLSSRESWKTVLAKLAEQHH
ncbi:glutathione S-transferase [Panaeolus papilionaceus]|nr:glutathione S-transferase [Panaeolus papilionaceus]